MIHWRNDHYSGDHDTLESSGDHDTLKPTSTADHVESALVTVTWVMRLLQTELAVRLTQL